MMTSTAIYKQSLFYKLSLKQFEICGTRFEGEKPRNNHVMKTVQHKQAAMPSGCAFLCSNENP